MDLVVCGTAKSCAGFWPLTFYISISKGNKEIVFVMLNELMYNHEKHL